MKLYTRKALRRGLLPWQHHIAITSPTGTGGSTLMGILRDFLEPQEYQFFSAGDYMRKLQAEQSVSTIEELTLRNASNFDNDHRVDEETRRFVQQEKVVVESRVGKLFMPHAYHVLLTCPMTVRADRRKKGKSIKAFTDAVVRILERDIRDSERYDNLYPGHNWDVSDYDLVIHTNVLNPQQVARRVLDSHAEWWRSQKKTDTWFPSARD